MNPLIDVAIAIAIFGFGWIQHCDCVLRLPGESSGADKEVEFAVKCGIPVYYSISELKSLQPIERTS